MPSSVVSKIIYKEETETLRIVYVSGMVYDYKKVPWEVYEAMKSSGSKGIFLNKHIKGNYEFEKVED
ncbi:KTSC domain-containing protein [Dyadobacter pollutisoli]|uniref:KTSC domain-containing protein n=1 Tax=Dyadobacter pollutisoli TaxID=2910158 RepID=A0A9E8SR45_9BACT|nr:KTSC domain-containing protein [Dyadobacter pollutisoli]WAC13787.1 KTSC domain-containing protein [Dyadobacter pollutisoli]